MTKTNQLRPALTLAAVMALFGTVGVFRRYIELSSAIITLGRGTVGALFLLIQLRLRGKSPDWDAIRRSLPRLLLSGAFLGINWILFFEANRRTTVAAATLAYYMEPSFLILIAALMGERPGRRGAVCTIVSFVGMVLVSGVLQGGFSGFAGIALGLGAAVFYTAVVLMNRSLSGLRATDRSMVQLAVAAVVVLPYCLLTEKAGSLHAPATSYLLLLVLGVLHTGIAYSVYFDCITRLSARTTALFSYIDPVVAVLLSAFLLHEPLGTAGIIGGVLILGAAVVSELPGHTAE